MKKKIIIVGIFVIIVLILVSVYYITSQNKQETTDITYSIHDNLDMYDSHYSERGVYYDTENRPNAPSYYTIAMGEKNTGGYSIEIDKVNIDSDGNVEVIVKETSPEVGGAVTMAFTYPVCRITLNKLPKSIVVENTNGEKFEKINF